MPAGVAGFEDRSTADSSDRPKDGVLDMSANSSQTLKIRCNRVRGRLAYTMLDNVFECGDKAKRRMWRCYLSKARRRRVRTGRTRRECSDIVISITLCRRCRVWRTQNRHSRPCCSALIISRVLEKSHCGGLRLGERSFLCCSARWPIKNSARTAWKALLATSRQPSFLPHLVSSTRR